MRHKLLWIVAVTSTCFAMSTQTLQQSEMTPQPEKALITLNSISYAYPQSTTSPNDIKTLLSTKTLSKQVIHKVLTTLECARNYNLVNNSILTVIDYSLPSNVKRLWIFNLKTKQLLFHTYVSHGIKSGSLLTTNFSNRYNSKSSSMGVYITEEAYHGREGISLRLTGLDQGFNDNASNRAIVMHGGWYMDDNFIEKYGRAGRSWGCPAVPLTLSESIINTIKDHSLMVVYYPNEAWFERSPFLNCHTPPSLTFSQHKAPVTASTSEVETRDPVLFANIKIKYGETEPVITMPANRYIKTFQNKAPLTRMLRRQINQQEYIALSTAELKTLSELSDKTILNDIYFVVPHIKMERGYYLTEMEIINLGKVINIQLQNTSTTTPEHLAFTVYFDHRAPITLHASQQFIRWLGL